jgi:hypothetical protein
MYGHYVLRKPEATVELDLNQDMTYRETILFRSGQKAEVSGKWFFVPADSSVSLIGAATVAIPIEPGHIDIDNPGMESMRWFGKMHITAYVAADGDHDFVQENVK